MDPSFGQHLIMVVAFDVATRKTRVLVSGGWYGVFSPVGKALAYVTGGVGTPGALALWVADARGRHGRKLVSASGTLFSPAWPPDGRTIAYIKGGSYAVDHNPFVYYNDVSSNPQCPNLKSYADLSGDLANSTVARYNVIVPDKCDDMHEPCAPISDPIKQGDTWLQNNVPAILSSPPYKKGGALFITWDEGEHSTDGPIGMIVLSPDARGGGYANTLHYTHSSTLRTLEEIFGVSPYLGDAANATDLRDLFRTFP